MGKHRSMAAVLVVVALGATACGETGGSAAEEGVLAGEIFVSGSSTVEPITALVAELFHEDHPEVAINVEGPGTGDGFELFCNGETDISDASRTIKEEEAEVCADNGVEYIELEVAIDGLSVLTSSENEFVECLNYADLYALLGPESQGFERWSDANELAIELGGIGAPYPDEPLVITAPGEESGTYDSFLELAFAGLAEERGEEETARPDYQASANDNVIVEGIAGTPSSLGWVGFAFFVQNRDIVRAVDVAEGAGADCVTPTEETIASGAFPLARSLYIYVNRERAAEKAALRAYVDLYVTDDALVGAVERVGYVALREDRRAATAETWQAERPS